MSEIVYDEKYSNIELSDNLGLILSGNASQIKHTGNESINIKSVNGKLLLSNINNTSSDSIKISSSSGGIHIEPGTSLTVNGSQTITNDITLDNSDNDIQYIYLNYNGTSTNRWRIYIDNSTGNLLFERYNGSSWVSKLTLE